MIKSGGWGGGGGLAHGMFALLSSVGAVNSCGGDTHPWEEEWDQVVGESGEPLLPSQMTNFCFNCDEKDRHAIVRIVHTLVCR